MNENKYIDENMYLKEIMNKNRCIYNDVNIYEDQHMEWKKHQDDNINIYTNKYEDILYMDHHISKNYPQMSIENRAAQFSPFAALTGYDDEIMEARRLTDVKVDLDENRLEELDNKLAIIFETRGNRPFVEITYFVKDLKKDGGAYESIKGRIKKLDGYDRKIILENGTELKIDDIIDIV